MPGQVIPVQLEQADQWFSIRIEDPVFKDNRGTKFFQAHPADFFPERGNRGFYKLFGIPHKYQHDFPTLLSRYFYINNLLPFHYPPNRREEVGDPGFINPDKGFFLPDY